MTDPSAPDFDFEGVVNFRDLGGLAAGARRIRSGRLFRSGSLHAATPADRDRLRDQLGVRLVVDLRSVREIELDGIGPLARAPVVHRQVTLVEREPDAERSRVLEDGYLEILERGRPRLAEILGWLAETDAPAVLHCFAGKDRTGVVAAVVLAALGVSDEEIVEDYVRTTPALPAIRASLERSRALAPYLDEFPPESLLAERATMERVLSAVGVRFGGMREYVRSLRVAPAALAALEARLLDD